MSGNVGIGTTSPQNKLEVIGAVTLAGGVNASSLNVTGFSITDDSLVTLSDGSKKKIKDIKAGEEILALDESTGKLVSRKVNALRDHGVKLTYEMATKTGRAINTTAEHPYFVKPSLLGMGDDLNLPSSSSSIKNPSKSSTLDLSLSNLENELFDDSISRCGILSQTIPNIFSLGNFEESVKCLSLVTNTLCSDLENAANFPLESPFGFEIISAPCCLRNLSNLLSTFSSERNLRWDTDNDILLTSSQVCCILQSCTDMILIQRRECLENFFNTYASLQHLQNLPHHNSCSLESRGASADFAVRNNEFVDFDSHNTDNDNPLFKTFENDKLGQWIEVRYLKVGDEIAVPDYPTGAVKWVKIASIRQLDPQHVYDLSIEGTRNFIANDIVAHNTYLATSSGNVGIGTTTPGAKLEVAGQVKITGGTPGANKVLTSDAAGLATWQTPVTGAGGRQRFTASGTFTVPTGVTTVFVSATAGGGGGGGGGVIIRLG